MDPISFRASLECDSPPGDLRLPLRALWHAVRGGWEAAHECAQAIPGPDGAWIHAHLHREEGDLGNAQYWYRAAQQPMPTCSIQSERDALIQHFLSQDR